MFIDNYNSNSDVYSDGIVAKPLQEFTRFMWWMQAEYKPTLKWAVSLPVGRLHLSLLSHYY